MSSTDTFAPGNVVVVRDEDWLVTSVDESSDAPVLNAQGLSYLVRGQGAVFYPSTDGKPPRDLCGFGSLVKKRPPSQVASIPPRRGSGWLPRSRDSARAVSESVHPAAWGGQARAHLGARLLSADNFSQHPGAVEDFNCASRVGKSIPGQKIGRAGILVAGHDVWLSRGSTAALVLAGMSE